MKKFNEKKNVLQELKFSLKNLKQVIANLREEIYKIVAKYKTNSKNKVSWKIELINYKPYYIITLFINPIVNINLKIIYLIKNKM